MLVRRTYEKEKMGEEGYSSKAEQSMKRKETKIKKTGGKSKKGTSKSNEAKKFRKVPEQIVSSLAITG